MDAAQDLSSDPADRGALTIGARVALIGLCLVAAFTYRASVSLIHGALLEDAFLLGLSGVFLAVAYALRRGRGGLRQYWEIAFAFSVFTFAGLLGDGNVSPLVRAFANGVLHEAPTAHNPFGVTITGTLLAQVFGTLALVLPIILLTKASGVDLRSIYLDHSRGTWPLVVGVLTFVVIFFLAARGRTAAFFPTHGQMTFSRVVELGPVLVPLVLLNGLREELWFRGLFLKRYEQFLGRGGANVLAAVIFTSFHVQVQYSASIVPFLGVTLVNGLFLGWLMQRSRSVIAPVLFHAATDIPIFLVYLSYAR